ncbi:MAG: hypothetical protein ACYC59_10430 [Anaerolineaceae bacterium]
MELVLQQGFLQGYLEVLGNDLLCDILGGKTPSFIVEKKKKSFTEPLDPDFFEFFDKTLQKKYGKLTSEGIARSAGRLAFKAYKDAIPVLVERGSIENRLLPFSEKISGALQDLLDELNANAFAALRMERVAQDNTWLYKGRLCLPKGMFLQVGDQQFFMGMLESMLEWLDSRHGFQVDQKANLQEQRSGKIDLLISVKRYD